MIDYLEDLLLQQEDEEEEGGAPPGTKRAVLPFPRGGGPQGGRVQAAAGALQAAAGEAQAAAGETARGGQAEDLDKAEEGGSGLEEAPRDGEETPAGVLLGASRTLLWEPGAALRQEGSAGGQTPERTLRAAPERPEGYLTARLGRSWTAGLYREAAAASRAAASLRQGGERLLVAEEQRTPSAAPGAAELDEIFARDARRYDGGFSMY